MRALAAAARMALLAQRGQGILWSPVLLAVGIGIYFTIRFEPSVTALLCLGGASLVCLAMSRLIGEAMAPLAIGVGLVALGFLIAALRAHAVAAPVLEWRYYGPVEGRIVAMDRSGSDALRLTLDQVRLDRVPPAKVPRRVRLSLHSDLTGAVPQPGLRVMTTAHLSPPSGPVEPGGFDFQRHAFFARLGAVGYTRVPLMAAEAAPEKSLGLAVFRLRIALSARIQEHLTGDTGGFAAAITTGDRSAISRETVEALRITNLAHLLAISGLHMGLLSAAVFGFLRVTLAAIPRAALGWPTKEIAAISALAVASLYLALSGGNVATQRAFIMVAVALGALMLGRRALSLRAVAVAALLVLVLRPEALTGPGFQMSFAATTALVAVFGLLQKVEMGWMPALLRPAFGLFVSSAVAGLATAPIAAAHFNGIAHYGLIANLLSVPLMGLLIIPAALIAALLAPLGAEGIGLWAMGLGLDWILFVAHTIAGIEGARGMVPSPGPWVLPLLALGALFALLWQGRLRLVGPIAVMMGFLLWWGVERPAVLISDKGTLVGWMTETGRRVSREKAAGFVARAWLENDGDPASQETSATRTLAVGSKGESVIHIAGKRALVAFDGCRQDDILVTGLQVEAGRLRNCILYDPAALTHTGALALYPQKDEKDAPWRVLSSRDMTGDRLWSNWPKQPQ